MTTHRSAAVLRYVCALACWLLAQRFAVAQTQANVPPSPASNKQAACLDCHSAIQAALQKKTVHAAVKIGCQFCHTDHRLLAADAKKTAKYLKVRAPDLCLTCHNPKQPKLAAAHRGQPFDKAVCTRCHDPHSSDRPKLVHGHEHPPFAARLCEGCHQSPQGGKVRFAAATVNQLCFGCHGDMKTRIEKAASRHSLLSAGTSACILCHDPHATRNKRFLKQPVNALCTTCHPGVTAKKEFQHEPVRNSCVLCHDPHASDSPKNLYARGNRLCLECHGSGAMEKMQGPLPVALFEGRASLRPPEEMKFVPVSFDSKVGHPFSNHPVLSPSHDGKPGISCLSCHQPHAANGSRRLWVSEDPLVSKLCIRCHG